MPEETVVFARKASGLVREMSWWDILLFTIAGPAAGGMTYYSVKMPGLYPGGSMVLAFIIGGLVWLPPVLCIAAFASSFPRSGALYVVTSRVLHPMFGFIPNWIYVIGGGCGMAAGFILYQGFIPIASSFTMAGHIGGAGSGLQGTGDWMGKPWNRLIITMVFLVILWLIELMGIGRLKWVMRAIIYIPLVVTVIALILFLVKDGKASFDSIYGAGMAAKVQALAQDKGIKDSMVSLWSGTSGMLLSVFWAYSALEVTSFVGSEVKTPRTSFLRGMIIGWAAVCVLYVGNAWAAGFSFGTSFIRDYSFLYYNYQGDLDKVLQSGTVHTAVSAAPSIPFYASMNGGVAWLAVVLGLGYFFWFLNTSMLIWMAGIRGVFAMAFDRQLPLGLAAVSSSGNPTNSAHLMGVFAFAGVWIALMDSLGTGWANNALALMDFGALYFIWPMGLAAMFLPYMRTDLFEKSTFQYKWAGVPVISIIGAVTFCVGTWMMFNVGLELATTWSQLLTTFMLVAGLILVGFMYAKNRRDGIDPTKIFTEIPPA